MSGGASAHYDVPCRGRAFLYHQIVFLPLKMDVIVEAFQLYAWSLTAASFFVHEDVKPLLGTRHGKDGGRG